MDITAMTTLSKAQKNKILRDPVSAYKTAEQKAATDNSADESTTDRLATDKKLAALDQLHQQFTDITRQLKDSQNKSKKLSRQIGEAKREKRSCDELLQAMKQHSSENKNLKSQLDVVSERILSHFETDDSTDNTSSNNSSVKDNSANDDDTGLPPTRVHAAQPVDDNQVSISLLDSSDKQSCEEWSDYAEANSGSSMYHRIEWKQLIEDVFGHECFYFYASVDDKIAGILPLVRLNSRIFGDFMVSMPYFNSGGAIANSLQIEQRLMQAADAHAENIGASHIEYRDDISRDKMPVRDEKVNMILSLPDSTDELWQTFSSKLRAQIRRPQRENTATDIGGLDCLNDFYTVFAQNMRDLGTPVYSKSFFKQILTIFPESSKIIIVRLGNRPVAAAFLLRHNETLEIPWASTIKSVNHLSMNMLLYWEVLQFAVESKCRYFDFGRSSKNAGTFRFKQQWGAKPKQCYWHYWLKGGAELPSLNPNNPKFKLVIAVWKKIPVWLTKYIGPGIVKNLP